MATTDAEAALELVGKFDDGTFIVCEKTHMADKSIVFQETMAAECHGAQVNRVLREYAAMRKAIDTMREEATRMKMERLMRGENAVEQIHVLNAFDAIDTLVGRYISR